MRQKHLFPKVKQSRTISVIVPSGQPVSLILPERMSQADYDFLRRWFALVADGSTYAYDAEHSTVTTMQTLADFTPQPEPLHDERDGSDQLYSGGRMPPLLPSGS